MSVTTEATPRARISARISWCAALALACTAAWLARAFTGPVAFPHLEGWAGALAAGSTAAIAAGYALLLAGLGLGAAALRRPGRANRACAVAALALLAPFAVDAALSPLSPRGAGLRSATFVVATEAALAGLLLTARRAAAREARHAGQMAALVPAGPPLPEPPAPRTAGPAAAPRRAARTRPARLARLALALASLAVTLLLGELAFRALDVRPYRNPVLIIPGAERRILLSEVALFRPSARPPGVEGLAARFRPYLYLKGWYDRPQWDYFDAQGCVDYVFNRWGLRDHDFEIAKAPGEYRVVAIGDSFTFGIGAQLDDCWTEQLERTLRERRGEPVEVINAGFASGHQPVMYAPWIAKDGVRLQPDVLIVGLCLNDMHPGVEMYAYEAPHSPAVLGGRSLLANEVARRIARWRTPARRVLDFTSRVTEEPAPWEACQAALRASRDALAEHGIRLLVVPFPMLTALREPDYPYARLLQMVRDFCAQAEIECVDLLPEFLGRQEELLWAHPTDQHPNDRGHALIAAGIARHLAER